MARIAIGLTSLASLGFLGWFVVSQIESRGLSIGAALIGMPMLLSLFAFSKITEDGIGKDGKVAGWTAAGVALVGVAYLAVFFMPWLLIALLWLALHIPMIFALVTLPTSEP